MTEQSFTQKIKRENLWRWLTAILSVPIGVLLIYGHLALLSDQGVIPWGYVRYVFFGQALILLLSCGVTWAMRDAQRHDLYTEVRRHSLTQLRRFRGEINDEIERLEVENGNGQPRGRRKGQGKPREPDNVSIQDGVFGKSP